MISVTSTEVIVITHPSKYPTMKKSSLRAKEKRLSALSTGEFKVQDLFGRKTQRQVTHLFKKSVMRTSNLWKEIPKHPLIVTLLRKGVSFYRLKILLAPEYSYLKLKNDVHSQVPTHKAAKEDKSRCQTLSKNSSLRNDKCLELNCQKRLSKRK